MSHDPGVSFEVGPDGNICMRVSDAFRAFGYPIQVGGSARAPEIRAPEIQVDVAPDGTARLYVSGMLCRAAKAIVASPGGDVMVILDRNAIGVTHRQVASEQDIRPPRPLATDGQA